MLVIQILILTMNDKYEFQIMKESYLKGLKK